MTCINCTDIKNELLKIYTIEYIDEWFDKPHRMLGGLTPTAAIIKGEYNNVLQLAENLANGWISDDA